MPCSRVKAKLWMECALAHANRHPNKWDLITLTSAMIKFSQSSRTAAAGGSQPSWDTVRASNG